ncbi:MAG: hypothetical protein ACOCW6_02700 [Spirochaetota bacterium]
MTGCGIESITFVEGPLEDEIDSELFLAEITFDHNNSTANQSDDFLGYELYYKLYANNTTDDPYVGDQNSILAEPVPTGIGRLTNRGYRRIIRGQQEAAIPTILVTNKGLGYTITLDFFESPDDPEDDDATASWNDGSPSDVDLRRNTPGATPGSFKSFFGEYEEDDEDADAEIVDAQADGELGIAIYALGYGIEGGTFRQLYSEAVFLGYLLLQ